MSNVVPSILTYEKTTTVIRRITRSRQCVTGWRPVQLWFRSSAAGSGGRGTACTGVCDSFGTSVRDAAGIRPSAGVRDAASMRSGAGCRCTAGGELRVRALWI
jgi:hypothetical protein